METKEKNYFRNEIRKKLESCGIVEDGNDASKLYKKQLFKLKPISQHSYSFVIDVGECKWNFIVRRRETRFQFRLFVDRDSIPMLNFYALITVAIIHPRSERTDCFDRFHSVCKPHPGYEFILEHACEKCFLDAEGNIKVELQIQMFGEKVFPPLLVKKYRTELYLTYVHILDLICSGFIENTRENLKNLIQDKNKWSRFCAFMKESGQISTDQMCCEEQDVIKEALVKHFFIQGPMTSPLLMEILYDGYKSINAKNTTAKYVRIEENRFELVGDVPYILNSVVGIEYKPLKVNTPTEEDYESNVTKFGCLIVEIFVLDYLFRNKIEVNFTRSETEKKSKKKGNNKQNDELIAVDLEEDLSVLDKVKAKLHNLFINAQTEHDVMATTLTKKIDALIAKQKEHVAYALKKAVTELYLDAQKKVAALYVGAEKESVRRSRRRIRNFMKSYNIVEPGNDVSMKYSKFVLTPKLISGPDPASSSVILGEYKWTFIVHRKGTTVQFKLFADRDNDPSLKFYALYTLAIIHPLDSERTDCFDAFRGVSKDYTGDVFGHAAACEIDFLDAEGIVKVELQIQVIGENVFQPSLKREFRIELFLAHTTNLDNICSTFFEKTKENLKCLIQDKDKWSRFCAFMEESGQTSTDQMFWEEQDVIKEALVKHFFVDDAVTSPLLMEILYNGYTSINAKNTTAKFVRIEENRFELFGDVPSLFNSVVGIEYKPITVITSTEEDYESSVTRFGCKIVEIYVLDYLFRNKIVVNFTRSETEKKSKKKGKKKQNDESIAADLEEDTYFLDSVRALLNYLFMSALKKHEVIATTLKEKIDELIVEQQEECVKYALKKAVTELYEEAQEKVVALYVEVEEESVCRSRKIFRNEIRDILESCNIVEDGNDASKLHTKQLLILKPISQHCHSFVIGVGECKWNFIVRRRGSRLQFNLFVDRDSIPRLNFYALKTVAIIHPLDYRLTDCLDRFHSVCKPHPGYEFILEHACEKGFLDAEGNIKVELQIQMFGENVFPPLLVKKYRTELFLTYMHIVEKICSRFIENTKENLKSLIQDKNKWSRFCAFMEESGQISTDQMCCEEQDVIKEALVKHFFVDGPVTSPLLMEILYDGYKSINAKNTTAKFVRIEENRFELVGDVPSLFNSIVGIEDKPITVVTPTGEDYESNVTKFGCMFVEIFVLDYLFRNKIKVNFTQSELEKKSNKKGKKKVSPSN